MTGKRLAWWLAIIGGLQFVSGDITDLLPATAGRWVGLVVTFLLAVTAIYTGRTAQLPADFRAAGRVRILGRQMTDPPRGPAV